MSHSKGLCNESSGSTDWLSTVLNAQEIPPSVANWVNYLEDTTSVRNKKTKTGNSFPTASLIFKSVNPSQQPQPPPEEEPEEHLEQEPPHPSLQCSSSSSPYFDSSSNISPRQESYFPTSSYTPFSPNPMSEDLVSKVIDILSTTLNGIKNNIGTTLLKLNEGKYVQVILRFIDYIVVCI